MNITLIGMPGAGKSLVGKKLADRLGYTFLDIDRVLEQRHLLPLPQILQTLGTEAFLNKEAATAIAETTGKDTLVISPGGSIIYRTDAIGHLKRVSTIIYLEVPLAILMRRIGTALRGIVGTHTMTLADLHSERTPLYRKYTDHTIDGNRDADTIVADILKLTLD